MSNEEKVANLELTDFSNFYHINKISKEGEKYNDSILSAPLLPSQYET